MTTNKPAQYIQTNKAVQNTRTTSDGEGNVEEHVDLPLSYSHGASNMGLIEQVECAL